MAGKARCVAVRLVKSRCVKAGMASCGVTWHVAVSFGLLRQVRHGKVRSGTAWCVELRHGAVWQARLGMFCLGLAWRGMASQAAAGMDKQI